MLTGYENGVDMKPQQCSSKRYIHMCPRPDPYLEKKR